MEERRSFDRVYISYQDKGGSPATESYPGGGQAIGPSLPSLVMYERPMLTST